MLVCVVECSVKFDIISNNKTGTEKIIYIIREAQALVNTLRQLSYNKCNVKLHSGFN